MGISKTEKFSAQENKVAQLAKALGHPARVAIIKHLLKVDACVCGDIVNELPLAQATVSQHLKELKNAGIIDGCVEGTSVCYCVNKDALIELAGFFNEFVEESQTVEETEEKPKKASSSFFNPFFNPFLK